MKIKKTKKMEDGIKRVVIQLPDGSVFSVKDKDKLSALKMKLEVDELSIDKFISIFIKKVEKHWNKKTLPTKFPWDISWENKKEAKNRFKNQAELAGKVFYQYIRPYLLGILLSKATRGKAGSIVTAEDDSSASISFVGKDSLVHKKVKKRKDEI